MKVTNYWLGLLVFLILNSALAAHSSFFDVSPLVALGNGTFGTDSTLKQGFVSYVVDANETFTLFLSTYNLNSSAADIQSAIFDLASGNWTAIAAACSKVELNQSQVVSNTSWTATVGSNVSCTAPNSAAYIQNVTNLTIVGGLTVPATTQALWAFINATSPSRSALTNFTVYTNDSAGALNASATTSYYNALYVRSVVTTTPVSLLPTNVSRGQTVTAFNVTMRPVGTVNLTQINYTAMGASYSIAVTPPAQMNLPSSVVFNLTVPNSTSSATFQLSMNPWYNLTFKDTLFGIRVYDRNNATTSVSVPINDLTFSAAISPTNSSTNQTLNYTFVLNNTGIGYNDTIAKFNATVGGGTTINGIFPSSNWTCQAAAASFVCTATLPLALGQAATFVINATTPTAGVQTWNVTAQNIYGALGPLLLQGSTLTQQAANITLNITSTVPQNISQAQYFDLSIELKNVGQAAALNAVPIVYIRDAKGNASQFTLTSTNIPGGGSYNITTRITIGTAISPGTLVITANATATDANLNTLISSSSVQASTIVLSPTTLLLSTLQPSKSEIGASENLTLQFNVTNTGQIKADNVLPALSFSREAGISGNSQSPVSLLPGQSATFTFDITTTPELAGGQLTVQASVIGQNAVTGEPLLASKDTSLKVNPALVFTLPFDQITLMQNRTTRIRATAKNQAQTKLKTVSIGMSSTSCCSLVAPDLFDIDVASSKVVDFDLTVLPAVSIGNYTLRFTAVSTEGAQSTDNLTIEVQELIVCGGANENCCTNSTCNSGFLCCASLCRSNTGGKCCNQTWASGGDCCAASDCAAGKVCIDNKCSDPPITREAAQRQVDDAKSAIQTTKLIFDKAEENNTDVSSLRKSLEDANRKVKEAEVYLADAKYEKAKSQAAEAQKIAEDLRKDVDKQPKKPSFPWLLLILILLLLGGGGAGYYYIQNAKKATPTRPPQPFYPRGGQPWTYNNTPYTGYGSPAQRWPAATQGWQAPPRQKAP